jgi:hypothetical protein
MAKVGTSKAGGTISQQAAVHPWLAADAHGNKQTNIRGVQLQIHSSPTSVTRTCVALDLTYSYTILILPTCVMLLSSVLSNMSEDIVTVYGRQSTRTLNYF